MNSNEVKKLVLYVDDDPDDILLVREEFERYQDIELVCFSASPAFLKYIIELKPFYRLPSLIMLDINMPVLDGKEMLTILRAYKEFETIPIVLYTTSRNLTEVNFAKKFDALFMTKPTSQKQLSDTIQQLIQYCNEKKIKIGEKQ